MIRGNLRELTHPRTNRAITPFIAAEYCVGQLPAAAPHVIAPIGGPREGRILGPHPRMLPSSSSNMLLLPSTTRTSAVQSNARASVIILTAADGSISAIGSCSEVEFMDRCPLDVFSFLYGTGPTRLPL
jgi:hypothetical protein